VSAVQSDFCPTVEQEMQQLKKLLPRGRAWDTYIGGVRHAFFWAVAVILQAADAAVCSLGRQWFCATTDTLLPVWLAEYGFPDPCDPYADLCAKVRAIGGQTCDYFVGVAAEIGFAISCIPICGAQAGCAQAGCSQAGPKYGPGYLVFAVSESGSTSIGQQATPPQAGCYQSGQPNRCGVDLTSLDCVMQRICPAHRQIVYVIVA